MSDPNDSQADATDRLEHALERIALAMATSMARQDDGTADGIAAREAEAVKSRLDALIGKLRAGLAERTE